MEKRKKLQIKKYIIWSIMVVVVLVLAVMPMAAASNGSGETPAASILTAAAELRTIETQLIGGGQLTSEASLTVEIPENVKLTEYLVGNGDTVQEGEVIALVDKISVMTAITQVQEALDTLSEQIAEESGTAASDSVTAKAGGTVKVIYAQEGELVQDVMLDHGALAVLSLDGLMAVQINRRTDLDIGDAVCVTFSDGAEAEGRVKNNLDGILTVTVEDMDYTVGEKVTVTTEDGDRIGSGELYILNQWNATAYTGTISNIHVKEGQNVSAGRTLFSLEDLGYTAQFQRLVDQRQEYEALMQQLFQMYRTGTVTAPCDGIVTGVDEKGAYLLSESEESWQAELLAFFSKEESYKVSLLSNVETITLNLSANQATVGTPFAATLTAQVGETPLSGTWSIDYSTSPAWLRVEANTLTGTPLEPGSYNVTVAFLPQGSETYTYQSFALAVTSASGPAYTGIVARITAVMDGVMLVRQSPETISVTDPENPPEVTPDEEKLTEDASYLSNLIKEAQWKTGDLVLLILDETGALQRCVSLTQEQPSQGGEGSDDDTTPEQGGSMGGMSSGGQGSGMSSMGGSGGSMGAMGQEAEAELYTLEMVTIASVTSQEHMKLTITLDELDITRVYLGQSACVSVDALGGEQFAASVTEIAASGVNSGGNSKFTVELMLEKSGQMLPGMYASAVITLEIAEDVLCIPVAALAQEGTDTVVYTGCDENGNLSSPVTVTTGASDGEYVQILSGLSAGDACCYAYYDTYVQSEESPQVRGFSFGGQR